MPHVCILMEAGDIGCLTTAITHGCESPRGSRDLSSGPLMSPAPSHFPLFITLLLRMMNVVTEPMVLFLIVWYSIL